MGTIKATYNLVPFWIFSKEDKPTKAALREFVQDAMDSSPSSLEKIKISAFNIHTATLHYKGQYFTHPQYVLIESTGMKYFYYTQSIQKISGDVVVLNMKLDKWATFGADFIDDLIDSGYDAYVKRGHLRNYEAMIQWEDPLFNNVDVVNKNFVPKGLIGFFRDGGLAGDISWTSRDGFKYYIKNNVPIQTDKIKARNFTTYYVWQDEIEYPKGNPKRVMYLCIPIIEQFDARVWDPTFDNGSGKPKGKEFTIMGNWEQNLDKLAYGSGVNQQKFVGIFKLPHIMNFTQNHIIYQWPNYNEYMFGVIIDKEGLPIGGGNYFGITLEDKWWKLNNKTTLNTLSILDSYKFSMYGKELRLKQFLYWDKNLQAFQFPIRGRVYMTSGGGAYTIRTNTLPISQTTILYGGAQSAGSNAFNQYAYEMSKTTSTGLFVEGAKAAGSVALSIGTGNPLYGALGIAGLANKWSKAELEYDRQKRANPTKISPAYIQDMLFNDFDFEVTGEPLEVGVLEEGSLMKLNNLYTKYGDLVERVVRLGDIIKFRDNPHCYIQLDSEFLFQDNISTRTGVYFDSSVIEYLKEVLGVGVRLWNTPVMVYEKW